MSVLSCKKEEQSPVRYDELVFPAAEKEPDVKYGANTTQSGRSVDLLMDVYTPEGDNENLRPLIVLAHGGGFFKGDKSEFEELAVFLARSGYVVSSINYRRIDVDPGDANAGRALFDAIFDFKAAVRYFRKDAGDQNKYRIDPENIFIGGFSAGSITALHYAYLTELSEAEAIGGSLLKAYIEASGGMEGNSGNPGFSSAAKGVINISGALIQADLVSSKEPVLYSIHGTDDMVVPYLEGDADDTGAIMQGSGLIHPVANSVGITNELNAIQGAGHDAFETCQDCPAALRRFIFNNL